MKEGQIKGDKQQAELTPPISFQTSLMNTEKTGKKKKEEIKIGKLLN